MCYSSVAMKEKKTQSVLNRILVNCAAQVCFRHVAGNKLFEICRVLSLVHDYFEKNKKLILCRRKNTEVVSLQKSRKLSVICA